MLSTTLATAFFSFIIVVLFLYVGGEKLSDFKNQEAVVSSKQQVIAQNAAKTVRNFIRESFSVLETAVWLTNLDAASVAEQRRILQSLLGLQSAFRHLVLLNDRNRISAQSSRLSMDASRRFTDQLKKILKGQMPQTKRSIRPVYIDPVTKEPMATITVPVTNVFGDFKGTLIAELNLKFMWDIVDHLKVGETGYIYVSDRKGNLLAFEDTARVLKSENVSHVKAVADFIQNQDPVMPNRASRYQGIRGSIVLGIYTPLKIPDWAVITEMPWKEAYRETLQGIWVSIGITLVLAILAGIFGIFVARRLAAPVINLTETASRIAAGESDLQAPVEGPREVARLAEVFNSMTAQLRKSLKGLEQQFTDLKRTEEALRFSEERLSLALEGTTDGIWDWDLKTGEVYFSPRYYTMLGYEPDEFSPSYESWRQLLHPDDVKLSEKAVKQSIEDHSAYAIEFRFKAKNGEWLWILGRGKVVELDKEGKAVRMAGSHTDINKRKQGEEAFRREKNFSDTLIDSMPGVFYVFDEQGRFVRWNKRLEHTTGYTAKEISHMTPTDFFVGEEKDHISRKVQEVLAEGETDTEAGFATKDGRIIPYHFTGLLIIIGGKPHILGVGLDITERKLAESQSARLKVLLESVVEQSPVPMVLALPDGTVELFNDSCRSALGLDDEPEIQPGLNFLTLDPSWKNYDTQGVDVPLTESPLARALQGETTRGREMKIVRKNGTERWILVDAVPVHGENGEVMAGFLIFPDITERKQAEEALEKRIVALTQPLDAAEGITFEDLFDLSEIQRLQDLYAGVFGVAALITHPDGTPITQPSNFSELCGEIIRKTPKGVKNCNHSDAMIGMHNLHGPNIQSCLSAGLCNAGVSITVGGRHIANWLIGQVRNEAQKEEEIMAYAREIGADETAFRAAYRKVPVMAKEQFERVAHVLFELANQISTTAYQNVQQSRFIAERKHAEEILHKYERIVSTSQDLMALINRDYIYEAANDSLLTAHNKQREEIVGLTVEEVMGEHIFREKIQPRLDRALSGQMVQYRESFDYAGLGRRTMDITYFPMVDKTGKVEGIVLNARDITETRKLEEQLMQSQKIESIGTLAGGVAHEINNPINGIMNYAQLILDRMGTEDPSREFAKEIVHETQRIAEIVRNLLTFARDEKQSHSPAKFSDIVNSVLSLIQTVLRRDQIDLHVLIPEDLPKIKCRSQQIQQVLMNLMTNAGCPQRPISRI